MEKGHNESEANELSEKLVGASATRRRILKQAGAAGVIAAALYAAPRFVTVSPPKAYAAVTPAFTPTPSPTPIPAPTETQQPVAGLTCLLFPWAVLAGETITNVPDCTPCTVVTGALGLHPGSSVTGFTFSVSPGPGTVIGAVNIADAVALQAKLDLVTAYNDAAGRIGAVSVGGDIGGQTLSPGLYRASGATPSLEISSADLILNGDANAVWIFQIESTLTVGSGRKVILAGGALAKNVVWQVGSSATIGTGAEMKGNILALTSIALQNGASLVGRALARNGEVTLDSNTITIDC
jgi:Ice-binding-like